MTLSPAATIVLTRAAEHPDRRRQFHRKLPTGGRHKMIDALLRDGLIAETQGDYRLGDGALLIEDAASGLMLTTLALTDADALDAAPVAPTARANLRGAAAAALVAWDDGDNRTTDIVALEVPMDALRALLAEPAPRTAGMPRKPREGTKQEAVLALLARSAEQGHSGLGLEAQQTSVRAFVAAQGWTLVAEFSDTSPAARTTGVRGSRRPCAGAGKSAPPSSLPGSTASPAGHTHCRSCWRTGRPSVPPTCPAPTT